MKKIKHPFHKLIGDIISENISGEGLRILKDPACDPEGHVLPLYYSKEDEDEGSETANNSRSRIFTNVDSLILKKNEIKVIIEIEESSFEPIHIFGKFFAAAFSSFYSHPLEGKIEMADWVLFVQILDTSNLEKRETAKTEQWKNIKESIKEIIRVMASKIKAYKLFYGDVSAFSQNGVKRKELIDYIQKFLGL